MSADIVAAWCAEVAAGFRGHEHHTQDPYRRDRDQALVAYVVDQLGSRRDYNTAEVVEHIDRHGIGMGEL